MSSTTRTPQTSRQRVSVLEDRLALQPPQRGDCEDSASLLGLSGYNHDAVRIIMAAQVRLRVLRMTRQTVEIRERVRRIAHARDALLQTAVHLRHPCGSSR